MGESCCEVVGVALGLSVLANLYFIYCGIDNGVTITYMSDEIGHQGDRLTDVEKLFPFLLPNLTKTALLEAASKAGLDVVEKEEGPYVGELQFSLSGDRVVAVTAR